MSARLQPHKFDLVNCGFSCTLGASKLGDDRALLVHGWYEAGHNDDKIIALAAEIGFKLTRGSIARHRKNHLRLLVPKVINEDEEMETDNLSDIEILRQIIIRGARFIPTWKVGPNEFYKALEIYYRLTQGSAMEGLFAALSAGAAGNDVALNSDDGEQATELGSLGIDPDA